MVGRGQRFAFEEMRYSIPLEDCIRLANREAEVERATKQEENNFIDLYFRYLAARRDYPYAQHSPPPWPECWKFHTHMKCIQNQIEREFCRSNPGFVI